MRKTMLLALAVLAACSEEPKQLYVDNAWVRLGATREIPGAAYFTIHGGPADARLVDVTSPVVIRTELHESMTSGPSTRPGQAMASMKPIEGPIPVPANSTVEFRPGGKHVMLYNVNPGIVPPKTLPMNLTFADGTKLIVEAKVYRAGDPLPK